MKVHPIVAVAAALTLSCIQNNSGGTQTFALTLTWASPAPMNVDPNALVAVTVLSTETGVTVSPAPATWSANGVTVYFPAFTSEDVTASVQVLDGAAEEVAFVGQSAPFAMNGTKSGSAVITLSPPPSGVSVGIVSPTPGYTNNNMVSLTLTAGTASTAVQAIVSNTLSGGISVDLTKMTMTNGAYTLSGWDLNAGLPTTPSCDVTTAQAGCVRNVYAEFFDQNGNQSDPVTASIVLDQVAPTVVTSVSPATAGLGDTVAVDLTFSEPLSAAPTLSVTPTLTFTAVEGTQYTFAHQVTGTDANGMYRVSAAVTDLAGNAATLMAGSFTVDSTAVAITNVATSATRFSAQAAFNQITATFDVNDSSAAVSVSIGGLVFACTSSTTAPNETCVYTVTGNEVEGDQVIVITATNSAGNTATATAVVTLDFTPPSLTSYLVVPASVSAGAGGTETLAVSYSEALAQDPVVAASGPGSITFTANTANAFSAVISAITAQGSYTTSFQMTDLVGNTGIAAGPSFTVTP